MPSGFTFPTIKTTAEHQPWAGKKATGPQSAIDMANQLADAELLSQLTSSAPEIGSGAFAMQPFGARAVA